MAPVPQDSVHPSDAALFDPLFLRFVYEHRQDDVSRLLLGRAPSGIDLRQAAEQITAWQKARAKLPDWYAAADLVMPPPLSVEQASSQLTAEYKAGLLSGDCLVDLCAGMGVDTLAFARRFARTLYVEREPALCRRFAHNAARLLAEGHAGRPVEVINTSAEAFVEGFAGEATFYVDPARRDAERQRAFLLEACTPDLTTLLPRLQGRARQVLVKASPMIDLAAGIGSLGAVRAVHVVSVANECKEVLFLVEFGFVGTPEIRCVNLRPTGPPETFRFDLAGERAAPVSWAEVGRYLYDPNAAIRKAGAFRTIGAAFGLGKLAPSTHLYTADQLVADFPGRVFEVEGEVGGRLRRLLPEGRASVISRNHPLTADQLRARYRLRDGGDRFLIGFRDARGRPRLVVARRAAGPRGAD
jgi:hypothetical protein